MPKHYNLIEKDSFSMPPGCVGRVIKRGHNMGIFGFHYNHALSLASTKVTDAVKTLNQLIAIVDFENVIYISAGSIASKVGVTKSAIHQHVAKLREEGIIIPHEDVEADARIIMKWRLCPFLAWKGTLPALEKYIVSLPVNHCFFKFADPDFYAALKEEVAKSAADNAKEQEI